MKGLSEREMEEVTMEVDSSLWNFVDNAQSAPASDFIYLIESLAPSSRQFHDMIYAAIEKLVTKRDFTVEEKQNL